MALIDNYTCEGQLSLFDLPEPSKPSTEPFTAYDIHFIVRTGTGFVGGKERILEAFNDKTLTEDFLKREYGTGGKSVTLPDGRRAFMNHDSRGINYYCGSESWYYTWTQIKSIIVSSIMTERW